MAEHYLRRFLFASRWLLAPLYVGLVLCLVALIVKAGVKIVETARDFTRLDVSDTIVADLSLVDLTLTGFLLVLVIFSGYRNFVTRDEGGPRDDWPGWMANIDFAGLKLRLMASIVAISAIRLLEAYMDVHDTSDRDMMWYVGVHLAFVVSTLILALADRFAPMHEPQGLGTRSRPSEGAGG